MPSWYERGPHSEMFSQGWRDAETESRDKRLDKMKIEGEGRALQDFMERERYQDNLRRKRDEDEGIGQIQAINQYLEGDRELARMMGRVQHTPQAEPGVYAEDFSPFAVPRGRAGAKWTGDMAMTEMKAAAAERRNQRPGGPGELVDRSGEVPGLQALMDKVRGSGDPEEPYLLSGLEQAIAQRRKPTARQLATAEAYTHGAFMRGVLNVVAKRADLERKLDHGKQLADAANRVRMSIENSRSYDRQDANATAQAVAALQSADRVMMELGAWKREIHREHGLLPNTQSEIGRRAAAQMAEADAAIDNLQQHMNALRERLKTPPLPSRRGGSPTPQGQGVMPPPQDPANIRKP